jgi:wxcM domain protein
MTTLADCVTLPLPRIHDHRGDLTFVESGQHIPFDIRRIYYLYNVPGGTTRGGHAPYSLHQYIIAINGSFDMVMDDGRQRMRWHLNSPHQALYIPPMIWHDLDNFSSDAVCMVMASDIYDESDYMRRYDDFQREFLRREAEWRDEWQQELNASMGVSRQHETASLNPEESESQRQVALLSE